MLSFAKKYPHWFICFLLIIVVSLYWLFWASDRYVSQSIVVVQSSQISSPTGLNFRSLLAGENSTDTTDMLLMREYLLSADMVEKLIKQADFREQYSKHGDFFSQLRNKNAPIEKLHAYYLKNVNIRLDGYSGVLRVDVKAFTPDEAYKINNLLLADGEKHMNDLGQKLAQEQVIFLQKQVKILQSEYEVTQKKLLDYQNRNGLISPTGTVDSINTIVANLQSRLALLRARKNSILTFQSGSSPEVVKLDGEINALSEQINNEQSELTTKHGNALNKISSGYETLLLQAQFAQSSYKGALSALQNTEISAARKLKQVSILESPTYPQYAILPQRLYNIGMFSIVTLFITLIVNMLILIIRDHRE